MKFPALITFTLLAFYSCSAESEERENLDKNQVEIVEEEAEADSSLVEAPELEYEFEWNQDSLIQVMDNLEQRRLDMWFQLEDAREGLLTFSYDSEDDYHAETASWYFTKDFEPLFYYRDFAAEGGYMENEFYVLTDGLVSFAHYLEDDGGSPTKYYHYINNYEGGEDIVESRNRRIDEVIGEVNEYYVPEVREYELSYFMWMKEFKSEGFKTEGSVFSNSHKTEDASIYGGTEIMGASVSIDSALFRHLYN